LNRKIKILYISHSAYLNGAEICLYKLVKNINKNIYQPIVIFPENGPIIGKFNELGVKTYILPLERWIRFKYDKKLNKSNISSRCKNIMEIIEKEEIRVVHTNTSVILEGAIAAKLKGIPHIWHIHEYLKGHPDLKTIVPLPLVYLIISFLSYKIVSVSNFAQSQFDSVSDNSNQIVIYNGIDEKENCEINHVLKDFKEKYSDEIIAITIGLLTESKGYENLLEAAYLVQKKGYKVKFLWIGDAFNKSLRNFKTKIKKLGIKNTVFYLGFQPDIINSLKYTDMLISSSQNEALPTVIIEAMAAERAVIATNCGGTSECVVDGVTGILVPVNDPIRLSEKIIEMAIDTQKRKKLGENGLKRYQEKFTSSTYIREFEKLYSDTLDNYPVNSNLGFESNIVESMMQIYEHLS